jgi:uncharacterized integral membrane protein
MLMLYRERSRIGMVKLGEDLRSSEKKVLAVQEQLQVLIHRRLNPNLFYLILSCLVILLVCLSSAINLDAAQFALHQYAVPLIVILAVFNAEQCTTFHTA